MFKIFHNKSYLNIVVRNWHCLGFHFGLILLFENAHAASHWTARLMVWSLLDGCGRVALGRQSRSTDTSFLLWTDAATDPWARAKAESYKTHTVGFPSRQNCIHWSEKTAWRESWAPPPHTCEWLTGDLPGRRRSYSSPWREVEKEEGQKVARAMSSSQENFLLSSKLES